VRGGQQAPNPVILDNDQQRAAQPGHQRGALQNGRVPVNGRELAAGDCPVSALAPYLRQAWSGAAAVSMLCALVGSMDWAGSQWPGIPSDD
jgi:hypothetical protein